MHICLFSWFESFRTKGISHLGDQRKNVITNIRNLLIVDFNISLPPNLRFSTPCSTQQGVKYVKIEIYPRLTSLIAEAYTVSPYISTQPDTYRTRLGATKERKNSFYVRTE